MTSASIRLCNLRLSPIPFSRLRSPRPTAFATSISPSHCLRNLILLIEIQLPPPLETFSSGKIACLIRTQKGWVWKDDDDDRNSGEINKFENTSPRSDGQCSTRKIISSQCRTEDMKHGKFIKKCEKTEQLLKDCVGRSC